MASPRNLYEAGFQRKEDESEFHAGANSALCVLLPWEIIKSATRRRRMRESTERSKRVPRHRATPSHARCGSWRAGPRQARNLATVRYNRGEHLPFRHFRRVFQCGASIFTSSLPQPGRHEPIDCKSRNPGEPWFSIIISPNGFCKKRLPAGL